MRYRRPPPGPAWDCPLAPRWCPCSASKGRCWGTSQGLRSRPSQWIKVRSSLHKMMIEVFQINPRELSDTGQNIRPQNLPQLPLLFVVNAWLSQPINIFEKYIFFHYNILNKNFIKLVNFVTRTAARTCKLLQIL